MQVKTSDLTGASLDYAVAVCEGYGNFRLNSHVFNKEPLLDKNGKTAWLKTLNYSTDWAQGGPIIEREKISLRCPGRPYGYDATLYLWNTTNDYFKYHDPSPLIAAMRCYVASKLGQYVEIPDELTV